MIKRIFRILVMTSLLSTQAFAEEGSWSLQAQAGQGFNTAHKQSVGGKLGYLYSNSFYLGANYTRYLVDPALPFVSTPTTSTIISSRVGSHHLTGDLGYRIQLPLSFEIMPYLGVGTAIIETHVTTQTSTSLSGNTEVRTQFLTTPGVQVNFQIGPFLLGVDGRYLITSDHNAAAVAATLGLRF